MRRPIAAGSAKPSMPIALTKPSGSVAGMRACSSGRLDGVSSTRIASRGRRSASAASTWPARSGSPSAGGAGGSGRCHGAPAGSRSRVDRLGQRRADRGRVAEHGELDGAAVRLVGVLRDDRHARAVVRPAGRCRTGTGAARRCRRRARTSCGASMSRRRARRAGRWPANCGWSCGKPAWPPNGSWKTGHASRSASATQRAPAGLAVGAGAGDDRRRLGARRAARRAPRRRPGRRRPSAAARCGPIVSCGSGAGASQSSIGTITIAGPRPVAASW